MTHKGPASLSRSPLSAASRGGRRPPTRWGVLALASILSSIAGAAQGQVAVLDLAISESTVPPAILTPFGVLVPGEGDAPLALSCDDLHGPAGWVLHTGDDGLLLVGDDGPWASSALGCHWRRTTGEADERRIVGVHQPDVSADFVLFAIDDPGGALSAVGLTPDGGLTSTLSGGLSVGEAALTGMVGDGPELEVTGVDAAGDMLRWRSDDAGETFIAAPVEEGLVTGASVPAALVGDTLWIWSDGHLHAIDRSSGGVTPERDFGAPGPVSADSAGRLFVAAGADGLWRRDLAGTWEQLQEETTTTVANRGAWIWIGREVSAGGDPMVLASSDGGDSWTALVSAPVTWTYPSGCESSTEQLCHDRAVALAAALNVEPPEPVDPGIDPGGSDLEPEQEQAGGCGGTARANPASGAAWALIAALLLLFASARRRHGSP